MEHESFAPSCDCNLQPIKYLLAKYKEMQIANAALPLPYGNPESTMEHKVHYGNKSK